MFTTHFADVRLVHIGCVALSGSLFTMRGLMRLVGLRYANHRVLRILSYTIDTALLLSAIVLTTILHQYPLVNAWLTTKALLLVVYIFLGSLALKRAHSRVAQVATFVAALFTFGLIVGVAMTHQSAGWLSLLR